MSSEKRGQRETELGTDRQDTDKTRSDQTGALGLAGVRTVTNSASFFFLESLIGVRGIRGKASFTATATVTVTTAPCINICITLSRRVSERARKRAGRHSNNVVGRRNPDRPTDQPTDRPIERRTLG